MTKLLNKHKWTFLLIFIITVIYLALRLPSLTLQPIFADEAIYIRWAQVMRAEPTLRFLPLSDGKTPLFMWTMIPLFKVFYDPLFAGRFLSVLSGYATLLGVLFLGWKFFNQKVGLWAAFLIAITPFVVFFDRMALVDSMLTAFSVWSLNLALLLIKYPRLDLAMFLGYALGGSLLTKPPGFFNILVLPVSILTFNWVGGKERQNKLLKIFGLWMAAIVVTLAMYNILKLGPGFVSLNSRNQDYVFSPLDVLKNPLDPLIPHLYDLMDWLPKLLTIPIFIFALGGIILGIVRKNWLVLTILLWSMMPLVVQTMFLKTFTARYILPSIPPLLCLAGWTIFLLMEKISGKTLVKILVALVILLPLPLYFNFKLLIDPSAAPLPKEERRGYLEDWTAGYGFPEIARFLMDEAKRGLVVVGTEGSFGTLPDGLQIYLDRQSHEAPKENQVIIIGGRATVSAQLRSTAKEHTTFFVTNKSRYPKFDQGLKLLKEYPKAKSQGFPQDSILLFQVFPI